MTVQIQFGAGAQQAQGWQGDTHGSGQALLYDAAGNVLVYANKSSPAPVSGLMGLGLAGGLIARANRLDDYSTQRSTSEVLLFHDGFETNVANALNALWTQSTTGAQTIASIAGQVTLNNSNINTVNTASIITCAKQFPKYPHQPLYCRFRALITTNVGGNTAVAELGLGTPVGTTATVSNGAFFRWTTAGVLQGVLSYNGFEQTVVLLAQGVIATTSYYDYEVIVDDDSVRFIVSDSNGVPVVDAQAQYPLSTPFNFATSHIPSFARTYVNATPGGTALQLLITAHIVQLLDAATNQPWADQQAGVNRYANISPTAQTQLGTGFNATPSNVTPSNGGNGQLFLGGEYAFILSAATELSNAMFSALIPTPYSFMLTGLQITPPVTASAINANAIPFIEWMIAVDSAAQNIQNAGVKALYQPVGIVHTAPSATAAQGTVWTGVSNIWQPRTPILCLPGTYLIIGLKLLGPSVITTPGQMRGTVTVDGYYM